MQEQDFPGLVCGAQGDGQAHAGRATERSLGGGERKVRRQWKERKRLGTKSSGKEEELEGKDRAGGHRQVTATGRQGPRAGDIYGRRGPAAPSQAPLSSL